MPENTSKTGVFVDTKTGEVVTSEPEEGRQLVAPGTEVTPYAQKLIDHAKDPENRESATAQVDPTQEDKSALTKTVTTATPKKS